MIIDHSRDKLFGIGIEPFPPKFLARVRKFKLAQDGYWRTYAKTPDEAKLTTVNFIKMITKEQADASAWEVIPGGKIVTRPKTTSWRLGKGDAARTARGSKAKEKETAEPSCA